MASITRYTPSAPSDALHAIWEGTVAALHGAYSLPAAKFHSLINAERAAVHVASVADQPVGFALTYLIPVGSKANKAKQHYRGSLAALVVLPAHQRNGLGTQLNDAAVAQLSADIRASYSLSTPPATAGEIQLGSTFPRIFPGLPALPAFEGAKTWLNARGWTIKDSKNIDLYGALPNDVDLEKQTETAKKHGIVFRAATPDDEAALMELEYGEFDAFTGWPDQFPKFIAAGRAEDIFLAINKHGEIIGATLAAMPGSPVHAQLAWPDQLGSRCSVIACVGVSAKSRGEGAGVGMCAAALIDLVRRGADGCFIDWVAMVGFYERFGLSQWEAAYYDGGR
ncbi:hypothetical protein VHUM_00778 [Vanrija humicola]|uniref:N-acetyltransferase domain-containing protein n=1 Tax=Vanrija humicola TaxID=5417 RepID=A0A7D8YZ31_VANHU|nr:hypothetical protein VHUM_00778 [Vanrija humicola]